MTRSRIHFLFHFFLKLMRADIQNKYLLHKKSINFVHKTGEKQKIKTTEITSNLDVEGDCALQFDIGKQNKSTGRVYHL